MSYDIPTIAGRLGQAVRKGEPTTTLKADLAVARIDLAVRKALADAPPLNDRQKAALRSIMDAQVSA